MSDGRAIDSHADKDRGAADIGEGGGIAPYPPPEPRDDEEPDCSYCRGSGLSPHSIRDVSCPYCGGQG